MKDLLLYAWYKEQYDTFRLMNALLYYLRRLPIVGRRIPEQIFAVYDVKKALFWIGFVLSFGFQFLFKTVLFSLFILAGLIGLNITKGEASLLAPQEQAVLAGFLFWSIFAGLSYRLGMGLDTPIPKTDRDVMDFFRLDRPTFIRSRLFVEPVVTTLFYLPSWLLWAVLDRNPWLLLAGCLTIISLHLTGASLKRWTFSRRINVPRTPFFIFLTVITVGLSFPLIAFHDDLDRSWFIWLSGILVLLLVLSSSYLTSYQEETDFLPTCFEQSLEVDRKVAEIKRTNNQYTKQGLDMQKKLSLDSKKDLSHLTGMSYLNALLFERHRSVLRKKWLARLGFIVTPFLLLLFIKWFFQEDIYLTEKEMIRALPYLFIIMYALSMGKSIAQMVFVTCDIALLHYPFYREPRQIIAGFNYRWLQSFRYNGSFALALFLGIWSSLGHFSYSVYGLFLLAMLLLALTALFSFHDLFIYYILQPFTQDMEVVNPFYKFLSGITYWIAYANTQIRIASALYVLSISLALLLYVGIGYLVLLKHAPKTFVFKK